MTTLIVLAKECLPGRVKTRLHPPLSLETAAEVAAAGLAITLEKASGLGFDRRILCFDRAASSPSAHREESDADAAEPRKRADGSPGVPAEASSWEIMAQVRGGLDERIAAAIDSVAGPVLLIGMDAPQFDAAELAGLAAWPADCDAVFGPALDGGFWALGLAGHQRGDLIRGIPMSRAETGALQHARLVDAGLRVRLLSPLRDIDGFADLQAAAALLPGTRVAELTAAAEADLGFGIGVPALAEPGAGPR